MRDVNRATCIAPITRGQITIVCMPLNVIISRAVYPVVEFLRIGLDGRRYPIRGFLYSNELWSLS